MSTPAFHFGARVKQAIDWGSIGTGAAGLGALGAGLGGLYGAINPGTDENGNRKSRWRAALRNALIGGLTGGLGGAALGHFAPGMMSSVRGLFGKKQEKSPAAPAVPAAAAAEAPAEAPATGKSEAGTPAAATAATTKPEAPAAAAKPPGQSSTLSQMAGAGANASAALGAGVATGLTGGANAVRDSLDPERLRQIMSKMPHSAQPLFITPRQQALHQMYLQSVQRTRKTPPLQRAQNAPLAAKLLSQEPWETGRQMTPDEVAHSEDFLL